jgi:hypothetical protein
MDVMMRFGSPLLRGAGSPIVGGTEQVLSEGMTEATWRALLRIATRVYATTRRHGIMAVNGSRLGVGHAPHTVCHGDWNYLAPFSDGRTLYTMVREGRGWQARTRSQPTDSDSVASKPTHSKRHSGVSRMGRRGTSR